MKNVDFSKAYPPIPQDCYDALMRAANSVKEETTVKKKLPAALVLALALALIAGAALAVANWYGKASEFYILEKTVGYYEDWDVSDKIELVRTVVENGYLAASEKTDALLDPQTDPARAEALADEVMSAFAGHGRIDAITVESVLIAAWGDKITWPLEDKAWYSKTLYETGRNAPGEQYWVLPEAGDISQAQAVETARAAAEAAFGFAQGALDDSTVYAELYYMPDDAQKTRRWLVYFTESSALGEWSAPLLPEGVGPCQSVSVVVNARTGAVEADEYLNVGTPGGTRERLLEEFAQISAQYEDPLQQAVNAFTEAAYQACGYYTPYAWPLERKAAWSREIRPLILERMARDESFSNWSLAALATYVYGLPDAQALPEADALARARRIMGEQFAVPEDAAALYDVVYTYYDITQPERPLWKFYITYSDYDALQERMPEGNLLHYKIELDARTGETVNAYTVDLTTREPGVSFFLPLL